MFRRWRLRGWQPHSKGPHQRLPLVLGQLFGFPGLGQYTQLCGLFGWWVLNTLTARQVRRIFFFFLFWCCRYEFLPHRPPSQTSLTSLSQCNSHIFQASLSTTLPINVTQFEIYMYSGIAHPQNFYRSTWGVGGGGGSKRGLIVILEFWTRLAFVAMLLAWSYGQERSSCQRPWAFVQQW